MSKKITLELTKEQYEKIKDQLGLEKEISPFDRVEYGENYCFIEKDGEVCHEVDNKVTFDNDNYEVANYCTDEELIQQRAYSETLNRLLWRFSMMNDGREIDWDDENQMKYCIYYDFDCNTWLINSLCNGNAKYFEPYFISEEVAQRAIDEIIKPFMEKHPDFKF